MPDPTPLLWRAFEPGSPVVIDDGPLQGMRGTVLGVDDNESVFVAVALLRGWVAVELDADWVRVEESMMPAPRALTH